MRRRRLYHRCEQLFKEKISERGGGEEREEENGLGVGREIPRIFELSLSLSFLPSPPLLSFSQLSSRIPWEIGLNGVDRNRFSKINAFRRRTVSNDRDKRNEAIGRDTRYSNENTDPLKIDLSSEGWNYTRFLLRYNAISNYFVTLCANE